MNSVHTVLVQKKSLNPHQHICNNVIVCAALDGKSDCRSVECRHRVNLNVLSNVAIDLNRHLFITVTKIKHYLYVQLVNEII